MSQQYKNILLISLAALNAKERAERAESDELLLQTATFLLQYAFLLEPASEIDNFLKLKNAPAGEIYSENAGNLPGMGGIYNHINGDLYHYAGNNPVRYTDSDGKFLLSLIPLFEAYKYYSSLRHRGELLYKRIESEGNVDYEFMNLYSLYLSCCGKDLTLTQVGLADTVRDAVTSNPKIREKSKN